MADRHHYLGISPITLNGAEYAYNSIIGYLSILREASSKNRHIANWQVVNMFH